MTWLRTSWLLIDCLEQEIEKARENFFFALEALEA